MGRNIVETIVGALVLLVAGVFVFGLGEVDDDRHLIFPPERRTR